MTQDTWGRVRDELKKEVGKNNYLTWIEPLKLADCDNGVARFEVPTSFVGTWVKRNFGDRIVHHLSAAGARVDRIEFDVSAPIPAAPTREDTAANPPAHPISSASFSG